MSDSSKHVDVSRPRGPVLSFLGAAGTVTGSRFLIETARSTVLVDCGLFQGLKELRERNWQPFPADPAAIDAVVLTHAHVDHVGYLPKLVADGFTGRVICTAGTAELARIVLPDSGHLQEEEAEFANRSGYSKHRPALPLYTEHDARRALEHLAPSPWSEAIAAAAGVSVTLRPAGHILGSAIASIELADADRTIVFSGDLGRPDHPLFNAPAAPRDADIVVIESTYGGRSHDDAGSTELLESAVTRTAARGGTVLIPAFAVDRTEVVLYQLAELMAAGRIPVLPVYADSPMALAALDVYRRAIADADVDVRPRRWNRADPFDLGHLHEVREVADSMALAGLHGPAIIVSASGMATGGRVLHHLARLLPDPRNSVVMVGFQAAGTRGRLLVDGAREVKMLGRYVPVRADVVNVRNLSVHADHGQLIDWLRSANRRPETVFVVHGEPAASEALRTGIVDELDLTAVVPRHLERVRV